MFNGFLVLFSFGNVFNIENNICFMIFVKVKTLKRRVLKKTRVVSEFLSVLPM